MTLSNLSTGSHCWTASVTDHPWGALAPDAIAEAACNALLLELATYPKPGLVSFQDTGSHADMDAHTFLASIQALRPSFRDMASAGSAGAGMEPLRILGLEAEGRMFAATGGVNTHKGAIFSLGLLAAASGALGAGGLLPVFDNLSAYIRQRFGSEILASFPDEANSAGERARCLHGVGGARLEAGLGFPTVARVGLPSLEEALDAKLPLVRACVHCFFALLEVADDTTLIHRGGLTGLDLAKRSAAAFNRLGGALAPDWKHRAVQLHQEFSAANLSAGGVADLLSVTLFCRLMGVHA